MPPAFISADAVNVKSQIPQLTVVEDVLFSSDAEYVKSQIPQLTFV